MAVENGKGPKTKIAADMGVPQNTLSTWLKKSEEIKQAYVGGDFGPQRKRSRQAKFPEVEEAVLKWFKNARNENVPISGPFLMHKANSFARDLGVADDFICSNGWLERFKERHGITFKKVCGESKSVDLGSEKMDEWNNRMIAIMNEYSPDNIFNADETGLFYRALSDKTLEFKNVDCHGGKQSKERLIVMVCANMSGTEKVKLLVIGKSARPRCFKNVKTLPTEYCANKKAWMVSEIFTDWVTKFDKKMSCQKRKVVLIVDNCPAHPEVKGLKAVKLVFLPPNMTSVTQPMDQSVILSLKVQSRNLVMQRQTNCVDLKTEFVLNVLDALRLLQQAWAKVTQTTIANCFRRAKFVPQPENSQMTEEEDPDDDIPLARLLCGGVSLTEYAAIDDQVVTSAPATDQSIVSEIINARNSNDSDDEDTETQEQQCAVKPPTLASAYSALDTLRALVETQEDVPDSVMNAIADFGNFMSKLQGKWNFAKQRTITQFFVSKSDRVGQ